MKSQKYVSSDELDLPKVVLLRLLQATWSYTQMENRPLIMFLRGVP